MVHNPFIERKRRNGKTQMVLGAILGVMALGILGYMEFGPMTLSQGLVLSLLLHLAVLGAAVLLLVGLWIHFPPQIWDGGQDD